MSVNGISCNGSPIGIDHTRLEPKAPPAPGSTDPAAAPGQARDQFRSDLRALFAAVKAGDMPTAQAALTALQTDRAAMHTDNGLHRAYGQSTIRSDFGSLIEAVQSGDASAAQDALATLQRDLFARGRTHGDRPAGPLPGDPGVNPPERGPVHIDRDGDGDRR